MPSRRPAAGTVSAAAQRLMRTLDSVWEDIRQQHPAVPPVVITLGDESTRAALCLSRFSANAWEHQATHAHEVSLYGSELHRGAPQVLGVLLHDAAHALNATRQVKDLSRQGRYHNDWYRRAAGEVGLLTKPGAQGWADDGLQDGVLTTYALGLRRLERSLTIWKRQAPSKPRAEKREVGSGFLRATCHCSPPRIIRMSLSTDLEGKIRCGYCKSDFHLDIDQVDRHGNIIDQPERGKVEIPNWTDALPVPDQARELVGSGTAADAIPW